MHAPKKLWFYFCCKSFFEKTYTQITISQQIFEREQINLRLLITNSKMCAHAYQLKPKRHYFANLDAKITKDNRKFWKTMNPLFSEKSYSNEFISLISKDEIKKKKDPARTFNNFFSSIVKKMGIDNAPNDESNLPNIDDSILKALLNMKIIRVYQNQKLYEEKRFVFFFQIR